MKTDTLFYQLFQSFHTLLFELIDRLIAEAEDYQFSTAETKEKALLKSSLIYKLFLI